MKIEDIQGLGAIRIGQLAARTGCSVPTIRYYEQIRLIPRALRSSAKQRIYGAATVVVLQFVRRCRELGFGIDEVRTLLSLSNSKERDCTEVRDIASEHLDTVRDKIKELKKLELNLARFIARCNSTCAGSPAPECSIFQDLSFDSTTSAAASGCCSRNKSSSGRN